MVLDDGDDSFVELVVDGVQLHSRTRTRESTKAFASEDGAKKALTTRLKKLRSEGYLPDDAVERPLPVAHVREDLNARGRAEFEAGLTRFKTEWTALGFDVSQTFLAACRGNKRRPNDVAGACLELAERVYGVKFAYRTRAYDAEHGDVQRVAGSAEFYQSPARVLAIALRRLQGRSTRTDDFDAPGLEDEIAGMLIR